MAVFEALMRVTHHETWSVEASNEDEARKLFELLSEEVDTDDAGGEVVDWEIHSIKLSPR